VTALAATPRLFGQDVRLDRRALVLWIASLGAITYVIGVALRGLYPTLHSREGLLTVADSPVFRALLGPLYAPTSLGGLVAWREGMVLLVLLSLATTFLVVRHTRAEEQLARGALVVAAPVGRGAPVAAALSGAALLDAAAALAIAVGLLALGQAVAGSLLFGASVGLGAWCFGTTAALAAQVAGTSRGANGAAAGVVAVAFLLRALGELYAGWLRWATPFGWVSEARPFAGGRAAVLLIPLVVGLVLGTLAVVVASRREYGRGLLAERSHPSRPVGTTPLALAWRLERTSAVVTVGVAFAYAIAVGSIVGFFSSYLKSSPEFVRRLEAAGGTARLQDAFTNYMAVFGGVAIGAWAVAMVLRLHTEEEHGRAAFLVANAAPRRSVFDGFGLVALLAGVTGLVGFGLGLGLGRLMVEHAAAAFAHGVVAGLVTVPALLVLVALALLAVGASPRAAPLAWAAVAWCGVLGVGSVLGLPQWLVNLSPFSHVPPPPLHGTWWAPCLVMAAIALGLAVAGRAAYERRPLGGA
jgi:ABC-2 type transport system permease protein